MRGVFQTVDRGAAGAFVLTLLGVGVCFAGVAFVTLGLPAFDSWSRHSARQEREAAKLEIITEANHQRLFRDLCPDYFEQPFYVRWTGFRALRWCEDFRGKI